MLRKEFLRSIAIIACLPSDLRSSNRGEVKDKEFRVSLQLARLIADTNAIFQVIYESVIDKFMQNAWIYALKQVGRVTTAFPFQLVFQVRILSWWFADYK